MSIFYKRYCELCASSGKSVSGVASAIGLSNAAASGWKKGKIPNDTTLSKLASHFGVTTEYLLGVSDQKEKPATVSGDELDSTTQKILDIVSDFSEEELALALARIRKIKESR